LPRSQVWSRRASGLDGLGRSLAFFHNQKTPALKGADRPSPVREGQSPHGRDFRLGQARAEYGSVGSQGMRNPEPPCGCSTVSMKVGSSSRKAEARRSKVGPTLSPYSRLSSPTQKRRRSARGHDQEWRRAGRGDALAARGHAAGPSLLERQPAAKHQYRSLANGIIVLGQPLRYRSLLVAGLRLDPGDGILPCTTVTELID
jgi:hypothetical protein